MPLRAIETITSGDCNMPPSGVLGRLRISDTQAPYVLPRRVFRTPEEGRDHPKEH